MYTYTDIITEIVNIASIVTNCVDDMEEQAMAEDNAQQTLDFFVEESTNVVELRALKAVADSFHYRTKAIDERLAILVNRKAKMAHFELDFELAISELEDEKHHQCETMYVVHAITTAEQANQALTH